MIGSRTFSGLLMLSVATCVACSSQDHDLGRSNAQLDQQEGVSCESEGGMCVTYEYDGCLEGVWGGTDEFPCLSGAACCFADMKGPQVPCDFVGGTCMEFSPTACDGQWLPANTRPCEGSPTIGCCVPEE